MRVRQSAGEGILIARSYSKILLSACDEAGKKDCSSPPRSSRQFCYQEVTSQMARLSQRGLADGLIRPISLISLSLSPSLEHRGTYVTAVPLETSLTGSLCRPVIDLRSLGRCISCISCELNLSPHSFELV